MFIIENKSTEKLGYMGRILIALSILAVYVVLVMTSGAWIIALPIGGIFLIAGIIVLALRETVKGVNNREFTE